MTFSLYFGWNRRADCFVLEATRSLVVSRAAKDRPKRIEKPKNSLMECIRSSVNFYAELSKVPENVSKRGVTGLLKIPRVRAARSRIVEGYINLLHPVSSTSP